MKTIEDIKQLKYRLLTSDNALRGYSNIKDYKNVKRLEKIVDELYNRYNYETINDFLKDEYIVSELEKITYNVSDSELIELLEGRPNDTYYNDASMEWIYDFLYNIFDGVNTLEGIDFKIDTIFGHYQLNHIVKNDNQYYVILEW